MDAKSTPITATCHCGRVSVRVAARPDYINECNCSLCGKRGAWWGYYAVGAVEVTGAVSSYTRADRNDPAVTIHFCPTCGCTTHWTLTEAFAAAHPAEADRMGVNMRLFDRAALVGVELRFPDGKAWDGVGGYGYVRPAERISVLNWTCLI